MSIDVLNDVFDPLVLENTVDALSVGRLVKEMNYSFHWLRGEDAYLVAPDGRRVHLETKGFVPVLRSGIGGEQYCAPCPARDDDEAMTQEEKLKKEVTSVQHMLTHRPKNPYCWVCSISKLTAKPARRMPVDDQRRSPSAFGQHVCVDHVILSRLSSRGMNGERAVLFIMDMYTRIADFVPVSDKTAEEAIRAIRYFLGDTPAGKIYSDNSKELIAAVKSTDAIHQTATPHRPQTNAFAERGIRTALEGARAALLQAGMPHRFWPIAVRHHAFASAIVEQSNGHPSPWFLHHGTVFEGWALPFGVRELDLL